MELQVKDPDTGAIIIFDVKPEQHMGIHGFRLRHPNGAGFFVVSRGGAWRAADDHPVSASLLTNIGLALEHHDLREQITDY